MAESCEVAAALQGWVNPWTQPGKWYKGNLHTHTTGSDGKVSPEQAMAFFQSQGYDFLCISDHERVTPVPTAPYPDMITIPGLETGAARTQPPGCHLGNYHILAVGADQPLAAGEGPQEVIDAYAAAGAVVFVAHPYWSDMQPQDMLGLRNHAGLEVFNTGCDLEVGKGISSLNWDQLLVRGERWNAIAVDDCHWNPGCFDAGQGWTMVRTATLSREAILEALRAGMYYSSRGPVIEDLRVEEGRLVITCSPVARITFMCEGAGGYVFDAPFRGTITTAAWPISHRRYVRVEVVDEAGRQAWTNPIYLGK